MFPFYSTNPKIRPGRDPILSHSEAEHAGVFLPPLKSGFLPARGLGKAR